MSVLELIAQQSRRMMNGFVVAGIRAAAGGFDGVDRVVGIVSEIFVCLFVQCLMAHQLEKAISAKTLLAVAELTGIECK